MRRSWIHHNGRGGLFAQHPHGRLEAVDNLIEENGRYGEGGFFMTLHSRRVAPYIGALGSEEQKMRILPRCASGETILGIALGVDRWIMLFGRLDSIRDCIAFPKTQKATDMMTDAPGTVDARQLRDLAIKLAGP